jgi:hypothetical protein
MKNKLIKKIKNILLNHGSFNIGELDYYDSIPCINSSGNIVCLADYFTENYVKVCVYHTNSSNTDSIDEYQEIYENLTDEVLKEILIICQQWECKSLNTIGC